MARHHAPTALSRTTKRAAVAATAVAATATMTVAAPGAANASIIPPEVPGADTINTALVAAPFIPGGLPLLAIPQISPRIDQLTSTWTDNVPVLGTLFPVSSDLVPVFAIAGDDTTEYPYAPGWSGGGLSEVISAGAPLGLGSVTNTTYGIIGSLGDSLIPTTYGSIGGNATDLTGPFGGALGINTSLAGVTNLYTELATFTPSTSISGIAPFGLGNGLLTFSPGGISYGDGVYLLTGPSFSSSALGNDFGLSTGQVGFDNGDVVFTGPTGNATVANPLDPTTPIIDTSFTGGDGSVGLDGAEVNGPTFDGEANGPLGLGGSASADAGGIDISTDPDEGINYTAPSGSVELNTPAGDADVSGHGGEYSVNDNGISLGDVDATTTQNDGLGAEVSINNGDTFESSSNVEGDLTTEPSAGISYDTDLSVAGDTVVDASDTQSIG